MNRVLTHHPLKGEMPGCELHRQPRARGSQFQIVWTRRCEKCDGVSKHCVPGEMTDTSHSSDHRMYHESVVCFLGLARCNLHGPVTVHAPSLPALLIPAAWPNHVKPEAETASGASTCLDQMSPHCKAWHRSGARGSNRHWPDGPQLQYVDCCIRSASSKEHALVPVGHGTAL